MGEIGAVLEAHLERRKGSDSLPEGGGHKFRRARKIARLYGVSVGVCLDSIVSYLHNTR